MVPRETSTKERRPESSKEFHGVGKLSEDPPKNEVLFSFTKCSFTMLWCPIYASYMYAGTRSLKLVVTIQIV